MKQKYLLAMVLLIILALCIANIMGCATVPCPKEDIVIPIFDPISGAKSNMLLEKGQCDDPENYIPFEEFERQQRERKMH